MTTADITEKNSLRNIAATVSLAIIITMAQIVAAASIAHSAVDLTDHPPADPIGAFIFAVKAPLALYATWTMWGLVGALLLSVVKNRAGAKTARLAANTGAFVWYSTLCFMSGGGTALRDYINLETYVVTALAILTCIAFQISVAYRQPKIPA